MLGAAASDAPEKPGARRSVLQRIGRPWRRIKSRPAEPRKESQPTASTATQTSFCTDCPCALVRNASAHNCAPGPTFTGNATSFSPQIRARRASVAAVGAEQPAATRAITPPTAQATAISQRRMSYASPAELQKPLPRVPLGTAPFARQPPNLRRYSLYHDLQRGRVGSTPSPPPLVPSPLVLFQDDELRRTAVKRNIRLNDYALPPPAF